MCGYVMSTTPFKRVKSVSALSTDRTMIFGYRLTVVPVSKMLVSRA